MEQPESLVEQAVYDAWRRWSQAELPRRRQRADRARQRALQTNDEVSWQHAEQVERSSMQLQDMVARGDAYFARIRGQMREAGGEFFEVDLRVHRYHRSESFPLTTGDEMLDMSHLAPLADLIRNPAQDTLTLAKLDRQLLGMEHGAPRILVVQCLVEDVELQGDRVVRTAPRYGAIFEDRVRNRLSQAALPALEILADVLDRDQNAIIGDRHPKRRAIILDGPAGTGKTVVAAHRIAVREDENSMGLYLTPTAALRDYVRPALPRLGLEATRAQVLSVADLARALWPELTLEDEIAHDADDDFGSEQWSAAFERQRRQGAEGMVLYLKARGGLRGTSQKHLSLADVGPLLWLAAWMGKPVPLPKPTWVIVDEAQALSRLAYRAMAMWFGKGVRWVLAGDLMQRGSESTVRSWEDIESALSLSAGEVAYVWLAHNYRVPPRIHNLANRLRRAVLPESRDSDSVSWHPHAGEVRIALVPDLSEMKAQVAALLSHWHAQGISAIAILAPDVDRVEQWANRLKDASLQILRRGEAYRGGAVLATLDFVRGLEFDAVLLLEVSQEDYPGHDAASARILYTAITRARRTLAILALSQSPSDWLGVIDD